MTDGIVDFRSTERGFSLPYKPDIEFCETEESARRAKEELLKYKVLAVDVETTGLDPYLNRILLFQIATPDKCYILNCVKIDPSIWGEILSNKGILKIAHNAKFDYKMLKRYTGVSMRPIFDTMLAERLLTAGTKQGVSFGYLSTKYFGIEVDKDIRKNFIGVYRDKFSRSELLYAANDVLMLHMFYDIQIDALQRDGLITTALLEFNTIVPVAEMELNGCMLNIDKWRALIDVAEKNRIESASKIQEIVKPVCNQLTVFGDPTLNIASQPQLLRHLHRLGINIEDTKDETLKRHKGIEIIDHIRDWRKWEKLCTSYGEALLEKINPKTGRLHAEFNQLRAETGRMAAKRPNLQQVPGFIEDDPSSLNFRSCFIAPEGYDVVTADYCLAKGTRVLTYDYKWVNIEDLDEGDCLFGVDEYIPEKGKQRRLRKAVVEGSKTLTRPCYRIKFSNGKEIVSSDLHRWLVTRRHRFDWHETRTIKPGDRVAHFIDTWEDEEVQSSWDLGYLAGMLDGEGSVSGRRDKSGGMSLALHQVQNSALAECLRIVRDNDFSFSGPFIKNGGFEGSNKDVYHYWITGIQRMVRLFGMLRPPKFLDRSHMVWENKVPRYSTDIYVEDIEFVGDVEVIGLQTSTRTFIAEGFVSHNSQQELRCIACISGDKNFISAYVSGADIHTQTAINIWGGTPEEVKRNGKRKIAKCVAGDTFVNVEGEGLLPIRELSKNRKADTFSNMGGERVLGFGGSGPGFHFADQFYYNGPGKAIEIEVSLGYKITVGENHCFRCVDREGLFTWRKAKELCVGDIVCLSSNETSVHKRLPTNMVRYERIASSLPIPFPEYYNKYVCRWLGYFISEGSVYGYDDETTTYTTKITVSMDEDNKEMVKDLRLVHKKVFGDRFRESVVKNKKTGKSYVSFVVQSKQLVYWLVNSGVGDKSHNKRISLDIFRLNEYLRAEFLKALYEGGGWSAPYNIGYCSKNEGLVDDIQQLLLTFGIWTSKRIRAKGKHGDFYYLTVYGHSSRKKFMESIGFITARKNRSLGDTKFVVDKDYIPFPPHKIEKFKPLLSGRELDRLRRCTREENKWGFNRRIADIILGRCSDSGLEEYDQLNDLCRSGLRFLPVSKKTEVFEELFDLSVPETRNYVSSGYLTHNTVNFLMCFGGSSYTLSKRLDIPEEEAEGIIQGYFKAYPGLKKYIKSAGDFAVQNGYSTTVSGRRRYYNVPSRDDEKYDTKMGAIRRKGANAPIQGAAADVTKQGLCNFFYALEDGGYDARLLMVVHDEIVCEVRKDQSKEVAKLLEDSMIKGFYDFFKQVPMNVDACVDNYWHH